MWSASRHFVIQSLKLKMQGGTRSALLSYLNSSLKKHNESKGRLQKKKKKIMTNVILGGGSGAQNVIYLQVVFKIHFKPF